MTGSLTAAEFAALFDGTQASVFRLEARQDYAVPSDDASLNAFRTGGPRPERSVRTSAWLRRIAVTTAAGVDWSRVRVVAYPLTEYTRWELIGYVESQAAGERIDLTENTDITGPDFWLIDPDTPHACAVVMHYTADGDLAERELVTDADKVTELITRRNAAAANTISLNEFLARQGAHTSAD